MSMRRLPPPPAGLERAPILVVSAVPEELRDVPRGGSGALVRWMSAGIGSRAADAVRERLSSEAFSLVVSTGFSGGARPGFRVGDLVMASEVVCAGSGRRSQAAEVPGLTGACSSGTFVTVGRPLRDPWQKEDAGSRYGAIALDMETAGVAEAAAAAEVPWVSFRVILDPMEVRLAIGSARDALGLFLRPGRWCEFRDFMSAIRTASKSLATGLRLLTESALGATNNR